VLGKDAPNALGTQGITVTLAELHQLIPGFSSHRVYKLDALLGLFERGFD
jgi:hypothetical protein